MCIYTQSCRGSRQDMCQRTATNAMRDLLSAPWMVKYAQNPGGANAECSPLLPLRTPMSELVGWVRHLSQCWREFVPERRGSYAMERLENLSDEVTEGLSSVRVAEDSLRSPLLYLGLHL